jgi:hypothetical protein
MMLLLLYRAKFVDVLANGVISTHLSANGPMTCFPFEWIDTHILVHIHSSLAKCQVQREKKDKPSLKRGTTFPPTNVDPSKSGLEDYFLQFKHGRFSAMV